jgi:alpha-galactosidase
VVEVIPWYPSLQVPENTTKKGVDKPKRRRYALPMKNAMVTLTLLFAAFAVGCGGGSMKTAANPVATPTPVTAQTLAVTPPMGWNSWYSVQSRVSDSYVRANADALVSSGLRDLGYVYVNIDLGWEGTRDASGVMHPNSKFPDMKALGDYIHSKGLKFGIYSSPGNPSCPDPQTDGTFVTFEDGAFGHEQQDANMYAAWGVDFVKYDACSIAASDLLTAYQNMRSAITKTGRPMVFSVSAPVDGPCCTVEPWLWAPEVGGNLWRTAHDGRDTRFPPNYDRIITNGTAEDGIENFAGIGHWNDPDILQIGDGGLTPDEMKSHMSLWAMLAAPLILGNDLTNMDTDSFIALSATEVIAVDQDSAGVQGHRVTIDGSTEVWERPLSDGATAILLLNRGLEATPITYNFTGTKTVYDLWERKDIGVFTASFTAVVSGHGVVLVKIKQ